MSVCFYGSASLCFNEWSLYCYKLSLADTPTNSWRISEDCIAGHCCIAMLQTQSLAVTSDKWRGRLSVAVTGLQRSIACCRPACPLRTELANANYVCRRLFWSQPAVSPTVRDGLTDSSRDLQPSCATTTAGGLGVPVMKLNDSIACRPSRW